MGFKYELKTVDGDDAGTFESTRCDWQPGDEFIGHGNTRWRIVSIIPPERVAELDKDGLWRVKPAHAVRDELASSDQSGLTRC